MGSTRAPFDLKTGQQKHCFRHNVTALGYQHHRPVRGLAFVRDASAHHAAMTLGAEYYVETSGAERDSYNWTPESSRRARGRAPATMRNRKRRGSRRREEILWIC